MKTCIVFCFSLLWLIGCKEREVLLTTRPIIPPISTTLTTPAAISYTYPTPTLQDMAGRYSVDYAAHGQSDLSNVGYIPLPGGQATVTVSPVDSTGKFLVTVKYPALQDSLRIIATGTNFIVQNRLYRSEGYSSELTGVGSFKYRYIEFTTVKQVYDSTKSTINAYKLYYTYKGYQ